MTAPAPSAARPRMRPARKQAVFLLVAGLIVVSYAVFGPLVYANKGWSEGGPLAYGQPQATQPLDPTYPLSEVEQDCREVGGYSEGSQYRSQLVAGTVDGRGYYGCYQVKARDGAVWHAAVVDARGRVASDAVAKAGGAWRWIGLVKTPLELGLGGAAVVVVLVLYFLYYRRPRPGAPQPARWWQTPAVNGVLGVLQVLPFTLPFRRGESGARRLRLLFEFGFGWFAFWASYFAIRGTGDRLSAVVGWYYAAAVLFGFLGGLILLRPPGFGTPDRRGPVPAAPGYPVAAGAYAGYPAAPPGYPTPYAAGPATPYPAGPATPYPAGPATPYPTAPATGAGPTPAVTQAPAGGAKRAPERFRVTPAGRLPDFTAVGGMDALKEELGDTFGRLLAFTDEADAYRIRFNGMLLHGPAGVGKTFVAKATAGEFGLNFLQVSTSDLVSKYVGESAANIEAVFAAAARNVPCLVFFDEFDAVAERRDEGISEESKRVVNQLLQSLEKWRGVRELVIVAATNLLDRLDPAVVRPGRFDRHIRVDLPDRPARRAILAAQLDGRPVAPDVDLDALADRTEGRTPATIGRIVESASLMAFRRATDTGRTVPIEQTDLRAALDGLGGRDRPTVEDWTWDRLVLADRTKAELRQVQALVADPDLPRAYGISAPSGLLLTGPPGTGKTTIARVFAAQAGCSFYPMSAADLVSKWVGESEGNVQRLFARARDNAPSIVFLDEVDAIAAVRGDAGGTFSDRLLNQLLTEIDGVSEARGVFVLAATNRPDIIDPALRRGGRLSRTIEIPLPDVEQRLAMLELFCARMPLQDVDLAAVADTADGLAGADLEALCQQAAVHAMLGAQEGTPGAPAVRPADFAAAFADRPVTAADDERAPDERDLPPAQTGQYL
ncbi:AAA family ATPase [Jatrophihabitans sp. YIM 134969]